MSPHAEHSGTAIVTVWSSGSLIDGTRCSYSVNDPGKQGMGLIDRDEKIPMPILSRTRIWYSDSIALEQMSTWKTWKLQACPGPVHVMVNNSARRKDTATGRAWRTVANLPTRLPTEDRSYSSNGLWFLELDSLVYWRSFDRMKKRKKIVWYRLYDTRGYSTIVEPGKRG